jgi:peptidoglycan/xylan/chitin deacetylase (PgdA/CDA1 family)
MRFRPSGAIGFPSTPRRATRIRIVAGLLTPVILALGACGGTPQPPTARWFGRTGQGGGQEAPTPIAPAPGPADDGLDPNGQAPSTAPGKPPVVPPNPATSPAGPGSPSGPDSPTPKDLLARLPKFPAAPPAEKITLPDGPGAAWLSRIPTSQKVAFLTIDDGWQKEPSAIQLMAAAHVPVTLFLTMNAIRGNPGYFKDLQDRGAVIEAHTITHTSLAGKSPDFQRGEICGSADQLGTMYGRRPVLFRPPFGNKDQTTLRVTKDCGMKAAFFWKETVDKGVVRYQEGRSVQPGDIILMHFRPAFNDDFIAALQAIHDAGLTPALLEDYVP